jgi:hypothetical protein
MTADSTEVGTSDRIMFLRSKGLQMSCLSVFETSRPVSVVARPIFVISRSEELLPGDELVFEVFEKDADALKLLVGTPRFFVLDGTMPSWGKIRDLRPCRSTHPGLARLREEPTLRGVLSIFGEAVSKQ